MSKEFYIENKIYYHDTDAGGVVYYAKYLEHLEEARYEFCRQKGIDLAQWQKKGVNFAVVQVEIAYKSPARYQDRIKIFTRVEKIGHSSISFIQEIKRDEVTLVKANTVLACIGNNFKIQVVPEVIKQSLEK